jgi:transcription antitermination factor NusG
MGDVLSIPFSTANRRSEMVTAPPEHFELRWYAAYTCANHEKPVAAELNARGVEHFLPLYRSVRQWKDRRARLDIPLFPGYVFVRLALVERLRVLQIPRVVHLVGFGGMPAALPDGQVEILRVGLAEQLHVEPHPFVIVGRRMRIVRGPLAGLEGVLLRKKGNFRFVLSVELIRCSLSVDVDAAEVEPVRESKRSLPELPISPSADRLS